MNDFKECQFCYWSVSFVLGVSEFLKCRRIHGEGKIGLKPVRALAGTIGNCEHERISSSPNRIVMFYKQSLSLPGNDSLNYILEWNNKTFVVLPHQRYIHLTEYLQENTSTTMPPFKITRKQKAIHKKDNCHCTINNVWGNKRILHFCYIELRTFTHRRKNRKFRMV